LAYRESVDLRKSFPGLVGLVKGVLAEDPLSGTVFVFVNRRSAPFKALAAARPDGLQAVAAQEPQLTRL
jgi:transposase